MGEVTVDDLTRAVRFVAAGCKTCAYRSPGRCSVCDRSVCAELVTRMDGPARLERPRAGAPVKHAGRPAGSPDITCAGAVRKLGKGAYPDGMPCKTCVYCGDWGGCSKYKQKNRSCKLYMGWLVSERKRLKAEKGM